ncbi:AraC family transcriptional regulator [Kribbella italica]|uniref:AraC-like DNA-binding protein n=1 Tax=Kribbella italica TaxID=1540520 RepID=A0A7W9J399_9ACTN|nr:helix-turn-helix domain-containing protein [Kribbella italica]MBB5834340.1 AraC-like DNA-binding protein [Kribbella italica]
MEDFELQAHRVHPALRPYLDDLIGYDYRGEPPELHRGLPSRSLTVVITLDEPLGIAWPDAPTQKFETLAGGLHSTAVRIGQSPNRAGLQLALTPAGSRALLGLPPSELASIVVPLDDVLGRPARELSEQLRETPSWAQRFAMVEQLLLEAWRNEPVPQPRAEICWAWQRLAQTSGGVGVQDLATEVGWGRRHLTERFRQEYGLAPKVAARVMRFEQAVQRLKHAPRTKLADLAADLGYADQAHLSREWNALAGCSPRQWIAEELPYVQDEPLVEKAESWT